MNNLSLANGSSFKGLHGVSGRVRSFVKHNAGFCGFVLLPTVVSAIYFVAFASPQYVSEAQFIVQGQHNQSNLMLAGLLQAGGGGGSASEDTYAVQDYVTSRDAAQLLLRTENLGAAYRTPTADALARFPNFYSGHTFEHFYAYYRRHVIAELDTTTGVSTLQVRTFDAQDSQRIARALVTAAENLVNRMNDRQRENTIAASEKELNESIQKLSEVNKKIDAYRDEVAMLNPNLQSQPVLKDIAALQTTVTTTRVELAQLQRSTPNSPLIEVYKRRLTALNAEISHAETGITGSDASFVPKISGYESLVFQRTLYEKEVSAADAGVATAKLQADRQLLYLNEITQPNLPDYAEYPHAVSNVAVVFATMFGLYLMAMLLISGAREHKLV
ncbi:capsule biosynthesis protein [Gluconobacter wancherniae]|uniref:capsule biosynthesis protein n=1 Tax=Gluconobacter wancherniae TaxID=1307955 RepID=UPI001B8CF978|nr:capsule biosynthesis protein [Gluconobacter wancherniae]MBS1095859.1 capsule biosynthesis protein [Gluconobacter wancherniae]